jgi:hypothetical protein
MAPVTFADDDALDEGSVASGLQAAMKRRWQATLGWVLVVAGATAIAVAWWQVRDLPNIALQTPYLISGGLGGAVLMGFGGTLLVAQDFRDERIRIRALEAKIGELEDVVVTQAEIMGEAIAILSAAARDVDGERRQAPKARRSRGVSRN